MSVYIYIYNSKDITLNYLFHHAKIDLNKDIHRHTLICVIFTITANFKYTFCKQTNMKVIWIFYLACDVQLKANLSSRGYRIISI